MRRIVSFTISAVCAVCLPASTLQQLSMTEMIQKSTAIVNGTVKPGSPAALRGSMIYTHYQFLVAAAYKGAPQPVIDVAVPGGAAKGMQQAFAGAPTLTPGHNYVLFLWTSKSGLTQIIGLSQGLFNVSTNAQGQQVVSRGAAGEPMLNSAGQLVADSNLQMTLAQLKSTIQAVLSGGSGQ